MSDHRMHRVLLGLGSNVGDRRESLRKAVWQLGTYVSDVLLSNVYESVALLPEGAPQDWNRPFLNLCMAGNTLLSPREMLERCKEAEAALGRIARGGWGPREIDIDLLACDQLVIQSEVLSIPHPRMLERDFVLLPLSEIAGAWRYPCEGKWRGMSIHEIARETRMREVTATINTGAL